MNYEIWLTDCFIFIDKEKYYKTIELVLLYNENKPFFSDYDFKKVSNLLLTKKSNRLITKIEVFNKKKFLGNSNY